MDLRQLEILRAVAEGGSFTGAGRRLHVSQSAVSRQILLLEEELHEQLFLRLGRKIRITPAGTTLLGLSQRMFEDLDRTRASILESQKTVSGTLRLVASPDGASDSVTIHADARMYAGLFDGDERATLPADPARKVYVHLVRGTLEVNGQPLQNGDAAMLEGESEVRLTAGRSAEVLVFDLAA